MTWVYVGGYVFAALFFFGLMLDRHEDDPFWMKVCYLVTCLLAWPIVLAVALGGAYSAISKRRATKDQEAK